MPGTENNQNSNPSQEKPMVSRQKTSNEDILKLLQNHPITHFKEEVFLDLLEHSLSLSTFEKKRVIDNIPYLSQIQIDELMKVFEDERVEFRKLIATEGDIIRGLVVKAQNEWEQLKDIYKEEYRASLQDAEDARKAEEIKKNLGV